MFSKRGEDQLRKTAFTEEHVAHALRQVASGTPVAEVCRKLGISEQTLYRGKKQYAGMGVAELRRWRQLADAHRPLKQVVADVPLDKHLRPGLQEVLRNTVESRPSSGPSWTFCGSACG